MSLAASAEWYARRLGLHIFPLAAREKRPAIPGSHGYLAAEPNAWPWSALSGAFNIGLSAIGSGLVVVDLDDHDAAEELPGELPPTWSVLTARGAHHIYRVPQGAEPTWTGVPGRVDVKWRGYSILPPSIHPSGHVYTWEASGRPDETALADAPQWLIGRGRPKRNGAPSNGEACDSFLGHAFKFIGSLGASLGDGKWSVQCPWAPSHTQRGGRSSTVIFAPRQGDVLRYGFFHCSHSHCRAKRTPDVLHWLSKDALVAAACAGFRRELAIFAGRA